MHGIIFNQLIKFVRENHGYDKLNEIMKASGLKGKFYDATRSHPDGEIVAIVDAACERLGVSKEAVLEAFGMFLVPGLMKTYSAFLLPDWKTIDLLSNLETTMHRTVRLSQPEAAPPELIVERVNKNEVSIQYSSKRQMHSLGVGLIKGIACHFKEEDKLTIKVGDHVKGKLINVIID